MHFGSAPAPLPERGFASRRSRTGPRRESRAASRRASPRDRHRSCGDDTTVDSLRGHLLIAGPALLDPNFWRAVVLVGEHSEEGALGLVLNRSSETAVKEALPELTLLAEDLGTVHVGGPVQPSAVVVLAD